MELIGRINRRKIYYVEIRNNQIWHKKLPKRDWIAFTIANEEDEELVASKTKILFDKKVSYTCSVGEISHITEDYIDEEIAFQMIDKNESEKNLESIMTTAHENFGEGFWFCTTVADKDDYAIDKIVCIDFTRKKVKNYLKQLIEKIDNNWIPSENENELPKYDS